MNLKSRVRKLEKSHHLDASGLVPHSDAWFAHYEREYDLFEALAETGGDLSNMQIPLAVIDRIVEAADREDSLRRVAV